MGDSCCNPHSLGALASAIVDTTGAYVLSLSPGGGASEAADIASGFFGRVDEMVAAACAAIAADPTIARAGAYHAVGFSQGGQFLRAVAQRCGGNVGGGGGSGRTATPRLRRLVTLGAQHQGVASLPLCPLPANGTSRHAWSLCAAAAAAAALGVDAPYVRTHLVQAQYFKPPDRLAAYRRANAFLADINNEHACDAPPPFVNRGGGGGNGGEGGEMGGETASENEDLPARCPNATYADALAALDRFVMVRFARDQTVVPRDSAWFSDVRPDGDGGWEAVPLRESPLYREDWLGLARLDAAGRLVFEEAPGAHMQFSVDWFVDRVVKRHLIDDEEGSGEGGGGVAAA
jgi:palmitoyl-protein thioesterase